MGYIGHTSGSFGTAREFESCDHCESDQYTVENDMPEEFSGVPDVIVETVVEYHASRTYSPLNGESESDLVVECLENLKGLALRFSLINDESFKSEFDSDWEILLNTDVEDLV